MCVHFQHNGTAHALVIDVRLPNDLEYKSVSSSITTQVVVRMIARGDEHTCVNSVWNHIAQWSVLVTRGGSHPKVRVRGSTSFLGCAK